MPVSYLPCLTPLLLVGIPLLLLARGRKPFLLAASISGCIFALLFLWVYVPGWILMFQANNGDPAVQYDLARWTENHCEQLGSLILWPCEPDVLGGFAWLEKAAAQDYPPAVYLVGVRLKHGEHVPKPLDWTGPAGNVFPQPERGQKMIDRALQLGFRPPPGDEVSYYMRVYRR
jgi:TPR repeat protein